MEWRKTRFEVRADLAGDKDVVAEMASATEEYVAWVSWGTGAGAATDR